MSEAPSTDAHGEPAATPARASQLWEARREIWRQLSRLPHEADDHAPCGAFYR